MIFNKFKGISKEREIMHNEVPLESILEKCKELISLFSHAEWYEHCGDRYNEMYEKAKDLPDFTEQDLKSFILTKSNQDIGFNESAVIGMYSGCLLHMLTGRNKSKGKGTMFYMNGQGIKFDNLFFCAKEVDELIIENFRGNHICSFIAQDSGSANFVLGKGLEGDYALSFAADNEGSVDCLVGVNIIGFGPLSSPAGNGGRANLVLGKNVRGNQGMSGLSDDIGRVNLIVGKGLKDENGEAGGIGFRNAGYDYLCTRLCSGYEIERPPKKNYSAGFSLTDFAVMGLKGKSTDSAPEYGEDYNRILPRKECKKIFREYKLKRIFELVDSMQKKSCDEIKETAKQIDEIYTSARK